MTKENQPSQRPREDELQKLGTELYGNGFSAIYEKFLILKPRMSDPDKCLAALATPSKFKTELKSSTGFTRLNISAHLAKVLDEYIKRVEKNDTKVTTEDVRFQVNEAFMDYGYAVKPSKRSKDEVNYPGMYGRRVYTGQRELGTRHQFDPNARPR